MNEDTNNQQQQQGDAPAAALNTEQTVPYSRFQEVNARMRELEAKLEALTAEEATRRAQELEAQQKWQELAERRASEIADLKPKAKRVAELEASLRATVEARVERLPESVRQLVPAFDDPRQTLEWLNKNEPLLSKPVAPALDAGVAGDSKPTVKLTPSQQEAAKRAGMSEERYIQALLKSKPPKGW